MSTPAAEPEGMETPAKAQSKRVSSAPARRRAPARATKRKPVSARPAQVESPPAFLAARLVAVVIVAAAGVFLLLGGDDGAEPEPGATPGVVSPAELSSFARTRASDVYWAGSVGSRRMELKTTPAGTFVRYLPSVAHSAAVGASLTVATYPLPGAYSTAKRRARNEDMTSRRIAGNGIAVWNSEQPTSVYLAWRGTPSLVEVYAPTAAEARSVALSGHVRPVR